MVWRNRAVVNVTPREIWRYRREISRYTDMTRETSATGTKGDIYIKKSDAEERKQSGSCKAEGGKKRKWRQVETGGDKWRQGRQVLAKVEGKRQSAQSDQSERDSCMNGGHSGRQSGDRWHWHWETSEGARAQNVPHWAPGSYMMTYDCLRGIG